MYLILIFMFGFVNLNKPAGFTSHDCIAKLRRLLNTRKIGHGGTLDPAATGVLPIAVGKATRLLQFLPNAKAYRATIRLGVTTTTDDLEGEILNQIDGFHLEEKEIGDRLYSFVGTIDQVPPIYSAIKQDGRKLYDMARKGEKIEVPARKVTISEIKLLNISQSEFFELEVEISCGAGTYIRAIARDLGEQLGVGGTLAGLVRTQSCGLSLEESLNFEQIGSQLQQQTFELIEPSLLLSHLNRVTLGEDDAKKWCQGQLVDLSQAIAISRAIAEFTAEYYLVTYDTAGTFLGMSILYEREAVLKLKPKIVLV
ncbi:MAG: tRNA pseudouridine(55) synthase TruB [Cyanobacteria bacterium J06629_2]